MSNLIANWLRPQSMLRAIWPWLRNELHLGDDVLQAGSDPDARGFVRLLDDEGQIVDGVGGLQRRHPCAPGRCRHIREDGQPTSATSDGRLLRVYTLPVYATQTANGLRRC